MEYNQFVEKIVELLQERMGEQYRVRAKDVTKNNGVVLTGVVMMRDSDTVAPTIYLEEPYRQFCGGMEIGLIVEDVVDLYKAQMCNIDWDAEFFKDFERVRERIFHKLVNYDKNRALLEDVPHFPWCDLALVFYYAVEEEVFGKASILIHNSHLAIWEKTADELYSVAAANMRQRMPELLIPMAELVREMTGIELERADEVQMYVLTNQAKLNGASAMLYSRKIGELADSLRSDLLILPSSVHEVLLLPDDRDGEYDFYRRMVEEVNTTQVEPEEVLSGNLYRYSREKAKIEEILG